MKVHEALKRDVDATAEEEEQAIDHRLQKPHCTVSLGEPSLMRRKVADQIRA